MIFEKEESDHRGGQVVLYLQFCTDNITSSTISYRLKIQNPILIQFLIKLSFNNTCNG